MKERKNVLPLLFLGALLFGVGIILALSNGVAQAAEGDGFSIELTLPPDAQIEGRNIRECEQLPGDGEINRPLFQCVQVSNCSTGEIKFIKSRYPHGWRVRNWLQRHPGWTFGACPVEQAEPAAPARGIYCLHGVAADLILGQPAEDPAWAGAVPAVFVPGQGASCDYRGPLKPGVHADGTGDQQPDGIALLMPSFLYPVAAL